MTRITGRMWVKASDDVSALAQTLTPLPPRWGKYTPLVRAGWLALGSALRSAQAIRDVPPERTGILACGVGGSWQANRRYFEDYAQSGRMLGRSSLFVYTLPSTPAAEYAIHFKLGGPLFYIGFEQGRIADALAAAEPFLASGEAERMAVVLEDGLSALGLILEAGDEAVWPEWTSGKMADLSNCGKERRA